MAESGATVAAGELTVDVDDTDIQTMQTADPPVLGDVTGEHIKVSI